MPDLPGADAGLVPDGPVVVALSGGPDSGVAAWLATTRSMRVRAVFVDHGWPGSTAMQEAAAAVADRLEIPFEVVAVGATATETAARAARLAALEATAGEDPVVTGHHAGDLAETVLANLLRGAGATGLSGIPASRPPFVRPLLGVAAEAVRAAAVTLGLPFADDPANVDRSHHRNRVRHEVLPGLEADAPGATAALARSAALLGADDTLLDRLAASVPLPASAGAVFVPVGALLTAPQPVAARIVRRALRLAHPPYPGSSADVAAVLAAVHGPTSQLGGGLLATREGPHVAVHPSQPLPVPVPQPLPVPGRVATPDGAISAARVALPAAPPGGGAVAWLGAGLGDLTVTGVAAGDRVDIGGHHRKAVDMLADAGIAARLRPGWPAVTAHGKIAWLAGVRVAAWARPGQDAGEATEVRFT